MQILRKYLWSILLIAVLIGYVGYTNITGTCPIADLTEQKQYIMSGMPAPNWSLTTLDGQPFGSEQLEGKIAIVNFWATWCPNCVKELPDLQAVHEKYATMPVQFVGISMDNKDPEAVKSFLEKYHVSYPNVMGNSNIAALFGGVRAIPTTIVIEPDGTVHDSYTGAVGAGELTAIIETLLPKAQQAQEFNEIMESSLR